MGFTDAQAQGVFSILQRVGTISAPLSVSVKAQVAGTVATVQVLTLGTQNLDFAAGAGASTCINANLVAGGACTEFVTFTPAYPGPRVGAIVLLNSAGNVLGTAYLSGTGLGGLGVLIPGNMTPIAGDGDYKDAVVDNIPATNSELFLPSSVTFDGAGNMYIADTFHHRIRKVATPIPPATIGIITTIAGNDTDGYGGDGGPAVNATLDEPSGVALDGAGNLYIADTANNVIRKITAATGIITTVAGNGTRGYGGDGLAATSPTTELSSPETVTLDLSANIYIADTGNQRVRRVDAVTGIITTVAGSGAEGYGGDGLSATSPQTKFDLPDAIAFDAQGNMYIADSLNNRIREVNASTGIITTYAGTGASGNSGDFGPATAATMDAPSGVAVDPAGNVYIADTQNNSIRKVNAVTGVISTIAASGVGKYIDSTGDLIGVGIYGPLGLYIDGLGDVVFADSLNMAIRRIQSNLVALDFTSTPVRQGDKSATQNETVENDGNAPLDLTVITHDINSALDPAATTCTTGSPFLPVASACIIGAVFAPTVAGDPLVANIDVGQTGDTVNSPLDIQLIGNATLVNSTTVVVTSSRNPSGFGQSVTFTATVTTGATTGNLTGTVSFFDGTASLAAAVPLAAPGTTATATFTTTALAVGLHTITASYSGDTGHFSSISTDNGALPLLQIVDEVTATSLATSLNPSVLGQNVILTATVTISGGGGVVPTGTVTITDTTAGIILGSQILPASGIVTVTNAFLTSGQHALVAAYGGAATSYVLGSTSAILNQDVQAPSTIVLSSNPNPSTYGMPVTFTVTVPTIGTVPATGKVNILEAGQANPIGTVTLAGNPATGTFTISSLAAGTDIITAVYPGDLNYSPSTSLPVNQVVNKAQTATAVNAAPNPGIAGAPVAIKATVTVTQGVATPTGTVTFTDTFNGATVTLGTATLGTAGTATINPILAPGIHSIVATYGGDTNDGTSASAPQALTVVLATTTITITSSSNPAIVLTPITFTAKVTGNGGVPTGSVTFLSDGVSIGTANLDATGTAAFTTSGLASGSHAVTASYAGDANDSPSASAPITEVVGTIPTVTDLGTATTAGANPQVILVATVLGSSGPTPTGIVTFTSGSTVLGTATLDSSGVATLAPNLATGTYTIVAAYSGDALHSPSTSQPLQVSATATGFNLTVTPASVTIPTTQNATVSVNLTSVSGFADTIGLGCASLPAGVTCHFASISVALAANTTQSVQLTIDTNNPLMGGTTAMNSGPGKPGTYLAGLLLPFSLFFGWIFWRFRRRHAAVLATVLVLLLSGAALLVTGCSGFSSSSAAPGTYVIQVTGTGANSDVIHYQNVTLTITK
jgi:sugar lactone lactonase YvrE